MTSNTASVYGNAAETLGLAGLDRLGSNNHVTLTRQDIDDIAAVVQTEVDHTLARTNPTAYQEQIEGVVDTITNRVASPSFPNTVREVVDQDRQFSAIAGPPSLNPYGSVANAPPASPSVQHAVESHLGDRARGQPSIVSGHVNYANPAYSTPNNLGWINGLRDTFNIGLGIGNSTHYHGSVPGSMQAAPYSLGLPDFGPPNVTSFTSPSFRSRANELADDLENALAAIDVPGSRYANFASVTTPAPANGMTAAQRAAFSSLTGADYTAPDFAPVDQPNSALGTPSGNAPSNTPSESGTISVNGIDGINPDHASTSVGGNLSPVDVPGSAYGATVDWGRHNSETSTSAGTPTQETQATNASGLTAAERAAFSSMQGSTYSAPTTETVGVPAEYGTRTTFSPAPTTPAPATNAAGLTAAQRYAFSGLETTVPTTPTTPTPRPTVPTEPVRTVERVQITPPRTITRQITPPAVTPARRAAPATSTAPDPNSVAGIAAANITNPTAHTTPSGGTTYSGMSSNFPGYEAVTNEHGVTTISRGTMSSIDNTHTPSVFSGLFSKKDDDNDSESESGESTFLCTVAHEFGWIDDDTLIADGLAGQAVPDKLYRWYASWAPQWANVCRRSRLARVITLPLVTLWANSMALAFKLKLQTA